MTECFGKLLKLQEQQSILISVAFLFRHEKEAIIYSFSDQFPMIETSCISKYSQKKLLVDL